MFNDFDFDVIKRSLGYLFQTGMVFTVKLTLLAMAGGIVLGTLLALMRLSSNKAISLPAAGYVNLVRSVPLVLVIFWCPTLPHGSSAQKNRSRSAPFSLR